MSFVQEAPAPQVTFSNLEPQSPCRLGNGNGRTLVASMKCQQYFCRTRWCAGVHFLGRLQMQSAQKTKKPRLLLQLSSAQQVLAAMFAGVAAKLSEQHAGSWLVLLCVSFSGWRWRALRTMQDGWTKHAVHVRMPWSVTRWGCQRMANTRVDPTKMQRCRDYCFTQPRWAGLFAPLPVWCVTQGSVILRTTP